MAIPRLDAEKIAEIRRVYAETNNVAHTAERLGINKCTVRKYRGPVPPRASSGQPVDPSVTFPADLPDLIREMVAERTAPPPPPELQPDPTEAILSALRKSALSAEELAAKLRTDAIGARAWIEQQRAHGVNLHELAGRWSIERATVSGNPNGLTFEYLSRPDNTFLFGACGDQHLGSKYARLDVLNDLYDQYAAEGVDRVFNTGNWIDGEAPFNKFDLEIHGMDQQLSHLAEHYPKRPGIETWAVAGNDHEGWYGKTAGVDIGRHAEAVMRKRGRTDWHHIGFIEAHVRLVNANTGQSSVLTVMHPGGGSAYAISYQPQKLVESFEGGEKPSVLLLGHYHKLSSNNIRNVWVIQTGCGQDQTPFMKTKRIDAHVGGLIVKLRQDPETGAIVRCMPDMLRYFNRGYYEGRWSHADRVTLPRRTLG